MSIDSFGHLFRTTTLGESQWPVLDATVDGCPPGVALSEALPHGAKSRWPELKARPGQVTPLISMLQSAYPQRVFRQATSPPRRGTGGLAPRRSGV
ncbi:hypothetical protein ABIE69_002969 [Rhodobacteraceae bacterium MBR-64]|jgi:hypothetical protein